MEFFLNFTDYKQHKAINENMNAAKSFLASKNIQLDDPDFLVIKNEILKNNPGYLGLFTKLHYGEDKTSLDKLKELMVWVQQNKQALNDFSKNLVQFNTYEEITDEINIIETIQSVKPIIQQLPQKIRSAWAAQDRNSRYTQALLIKGLDETDTSALLKKSSRYINLPFSSFVDFLKKLVDKNSVDYFDVIDDINNTPGAILTYSNEETGVIVASIKTHAASNKLGSPSWCISYDDPSHFQNNYMHPSKMNTQYFIWCTQLPTSDLMSMVGATVNKEGNIANLHNKSDGNIINNYQEFFDISGLTLDNFKPLNYENVLKSINAFSSVETIDDVFKNYGVLADLEEYELISLYKSDAFLKTKLVILGVIFSDYKDSSSSVESKLDTFVKYFNLMSDKYVKLLPLINGGDNGSSASKEICMEYFNKNLTPFIEADKYQEFTQAYQVFKSKFVDSEKYDLYILPHFNFYVLREFPNKKLQSADVETIDKYVSLFENSIPVIAETLVKHCSNMVNNNFIKNDINFFTYLAQLTAAKNSTLVSNLVTTSLFDAMIINRFEQDIDVLPKSIADIAELFEKYPVLIDILKLAVHNELLLSFLTNLSYEDCDYLLSGPIKGAFSFNSDLYKVLLSQKIHDFNDLQKYIQFKEMDDIDATIRYFISIKDTSASSLLDNIIKDSIEILTLVNNNELSLDEFLTKYPFVVSILNSRKRENFLHNFTVIKKILLTQLPGVEPLDLKEDKVHSFIENISDFETLIKYYKEKNEVSLGNFLEYIAGNVSSYSVDLAFEILDVIKPYEETYDIIQHFEIDEIIIKNMDDPNSFEIIMNNLAENIELSKNINIGYIRDESVQDSDDAMKSINMLVENFDVSKVDLNVKGISYIYGGRYSNEFVSDISIENKAYYDADTNNMCFVYDDYHDKELGFFYEDGDPIDEDYFSNFESSMSYHGPLYVDYVDIDNNKLIFFILEDSGYDTSNDLDTILDNGDDEDINPESSGLHEDISMCISGSAEMAQASADSSEYYEKLTDALTDNFFTAGYKFNDENKLVLMTPISEFKNMFKEIYEEVVYEQKNNFDAFTIIQGYAVNSDDMIDKDININASIDRKYFNEELKERLLEISEPEVISKFNAYKASKA